MMNGLLPVQTARNEREATGELIRASFPTGDRQYVGSRYLEPTPIRSGGGDNNARIHEDTERN